MLWEKTAIQKRYIFIILYGTNGYGCRHAVICMGIVQLQAEIAYRYGGGGVAPVPCERTRGYTRAARWGKHPLKRVPCVHAYIALVMNTLYGARLIT